MREPDNWLMSDEELDEYLDAEEDGEQLPSIQAEEQAQSYVRAYAYHHREAVAILDRAQRETDRVETWRDAEMAKLDRRTGWLSNALQSFLWASKAKSIKFPAGTLKRTKGREHVVVEDEVAFIERHRGTDLVRVTEAVAKSEITKRLKATGELAEGATMERGDDTFSIKLEE